MARGGGGGSVADSGTGNAIYYALGLLVFLMVAIMIKSSRDKNKEKKLDLARRAEPLAASKPFAT